MICWLLPSTTSLHLFLLAASSTPTITALASAITIGRPLKLTPPTLETLPSQTCSTHTTTVLFPYSCINIAYKEALWDVGLKMIVSLHHLLGPLFSQKPPLDSCWYRHTSPSIIHSSQIFPRSNPIPFCPNVIHSTNCVCCKILQLDLPPCP